MLSSIRPDTLQVAERDGVLWLTKVNAEAGFGVTLDLACALEEVLRAIPRSSSIRAVVMDAEGDELQNGAVMVTELKPDLRDLTRADIHEVVETGQRLGRLIASLRVPVIALARGGAAGGGLELLLRSDFVYCLDSASFSLPEVTFGFVPAWGGTQWAGRLLPFRKAQEMLLLGTPFNGREAEEIGLVTRSFPDARSLDTYVGETLTRLKGCSPSSYRWIKRSLAATWEGPLVYGEQVELLAEMEAMSSRDFVSAIAAHAEDRAMDYWSDREERQAWPVTSES